MTRLREMSPDRGGILVETVFILVLLTLPVFYLTATLARMQAGAYAVSAAAREAGRVGVTAESEGAVPSRSQAAARLVLGSHGFTAEEGSVALACDPAGCLEPGTTVRVDAVVRVELPLVPDFVAGVVPTSVELTASHWEPVEEFRGGGAAP